MNQRTAPPSIDWQLATQRAGNNPALASDLHAMLREELPERIVQLQAALEQSDRRHLRDPIHKLAGSCRYCGVPALEAEVEALNAVLKADTNPDDDALQRVIATAEAVLREGDTY